MYLLTDSNTTLVKVKCSNKKMDISDYIDSNTTLVKVKLFKLYIRLKTLFIQIQHLLKLNRRKYKFNK